MLPNDLGHFLHLASQQKSNFQSEHKPFTPKLIHMFHASKNRFSSSGKEASILAKWTLNLGAQGFNPLAILQTLRAIMDMMLLLQHVFLRNLKKNMIFFQAWWRFHPHQAECPNSTYSSTLLGYSLRRSFAAWNSLKANEFVAHGSPFLLPENCLYRSSTGDFSRSMPGSLN